MDDAQARHDGPRVFRAVRCLLERSLVSEVKIGLPLARRIIVDALFASASDPHAYAYRATHVGFYLAPKDQPGRVHDYRYDESGQTFFVYDALGDPVARIFLKDDEWRAGMPGVGELPFHFGGAKLLLATLTNEQHARTEKS